MLYYVFLSFFPALFAHVYREAEVHYQETR